MNKKNNNNSQMLLKIESETGSVLMEYVMIQVLVACLLFAVMNELYYNWATASFGPVGASVKFFYQRLLGGLSLPIP